MSIKVRCTKCRNKLWVDEAFAGGVCRCPFCKELFLVPDKLRSNGSRGRPESPRLHADHLAEPVAGAATGGLATAKAVKGRKGLLVAVLMGALAAVAAAAWLLRSLLASS